MISVVSLTSTDNRYLWYHLSHPSISLTIQTFRANCWIKLSELRGSEDTSSRIVDNFYTLTATVMHGSLFRTRNHRSLRHFHYPIEVMWRGWCFTQAGRIKTNMPMDVLNKWQRQLEKIHRYTSDSLRNYHCHWPFSGAIKIITPNYVQYCGEASMPLCSEVHLFFSRLAGFWLLNIWQEQIHSRARFLPEPSSVIKTTGLWWILSGDWSCQLDNRTLVKRHILLLLNTFD